MLRILKANNGPFIRTAPPLGGVLVVLCVLVCLNIITWIIIKELGSFYLEVVFFDVGQGDAVFIETPDGFQVLIDGGPGLAVLEKLGQEMPFYDRTIDLMILTHPEHDHLFGLLEVLKRYEIKNILWTGIVRDTAEMEEWKKLIEEEGANIIIAEAGQKIVLSEEIYLYIYYPFENLEGQETKYTNDTSIVAELVFNNVSFLFTGDISKKIEKQLIVDSDILKVAHHGSKTSTSLEFLEIVSPEFAVISVGENSWGHPNQEVLENLQQFNIKILITRELGDIKIISDGNNFNVLK
ncbi:MBL fold metallo-hydrolase [Patescibacteria group bacterium]|nr:MBL fold metallo-hydrolase [Patescibacteria group bacterium]